MSVNLMLLGDAATDAAFASAWSDMTAIAPEGQVPITDKLVRDAAVLLQDVRLSNGQKVGAYVMDEDDQMSSLVSDFGPSLLPADKLAEIRDLLAPHEEALRLLDVVLEHDVQIRFSGSDMGRGAHLCGCTSPAENVDVNMGKHWMIQTFEELGLSKYGELEDVPFEEFAAAVANPPRMLSRGIAQLDRLVALGRKRGSTAVYWG
jgi:hypothetical protein